MPEPTPLIIQKDVGRRKKPAVHPIHMRYTAVLVLLKKFVANILRSMSQNNLPEAEMVKDALVIYPSPDNADNSSPQDSPVQIQAATVTNAVMIPEYSVVRLEWAVSNVPPPVLGLTSSATNQDLYWTGLTNVLYDVESTTNLLSLSTWATLGRVLNSTTNLNFIDWDTDLQRFYRLTVP